MMTSTDVSDVIDVIDVSESVGGVVLADEVHPLSERGYERDLPHASTVVDIVAVNRGPIGDIAVSSDGRRVAVTNYRDDTVSVIGTDTGAVVHTVSGTGEPFAVGTGERDAGCVYVATASAAFDSILAIDVDTADVVGAYPVALSVRDLAVDPSGQRVYVTRTGDGGADVLSIDVARGAESVADLSIMPGVVAACIRVSPDGRRVYAAAHRPDGDVVVVLDQELNLVDVIEVGSTIRDVAVSPDGDAVFIASLDSTGGGVVHVVDPHANVITAELSPVDPVTQLVLSRDGDRAYLVTADGVVVICTRTHQVVDTVAVAGSPSCAAESPDGSRLYVANHEGAVSVVSVAAPWALPSAGSSVDDAVTALLELEPAV